MKEIIESGKTALGIEFGSTRIKAVLIDEKGATLASVPNRNFLQKVLNERKECVNRKFINRDGRNLPAESGRRRVGNVTFRILCPQKS